MSLRLIAHVLEELKGHPPSVVLLRHPLRGYISPFERVVAEMATSLGISVQFCIPDEGGRSSVFVRDFTMVEKADRVVAFFRPGKEMVGGTGHVVEAAIMRNVPTEAWAVHEGGWLDRIGEW